LLFEEDDFEENDYKIGASVLNISNFWWSRTLLFEELSSNSCQIHVDDETDPQI